jgi:hypothetical protein
MELPVEIVRTGSDQVSETGTTRNISSGGILFVGEKTIELDSPVEYVVTLASGNNGIVNLRCMGKVLRLEEFPSEEPEAPSVVVAVSLERYEFQRCKHKSLTQAEVA